MVLDFDNPAGRITARCSRGGFFARLTLLRLTLQLGHDGSQYLRNFPVADTALLALDEGGNKQFIGVGCVHRMVPPAALQAAINS